MPSSQPSSKRPLGPRKILLTLAILLAVAVLAFVWNRPVPGPVAPSEPATEAAPATTVPAAPAPIATRHIYLETANPKADIAAALAQAKSEHKRVLVDFGGDWCSDCQVLDIYFHQAPNEDLLAKNFVVVHVWIGHIDTNLDIPEKYGVAIHKGVPALAVLAPTGHVVYAQQGEFENMRNMESASVTEFLNKWKS